MIAAAVTARRDELRAAVDAARALEARLEAEARQAARGPARARADLEAFLEEHPTDPDPEVLGGLRGALADAEAGVVREDVLGVNGQHVGVDTIHVEQAARARGASRAREATEATLAAFEVEHYAGLLAEAAPAARAVTGRLRDALLEADRALVAWAGVDAELLALGQRTGRHDVGDMPPEIMSREAAQALAEAARAVAAHTRRYLPLPTRAVPADEAAA
ncbi:MAG: hypothetical protein WKF96_11950 [Solirubrobacteraceae bacterium]